MKPIAIAMYALTLVSTALNAHQIGENGGFIITEGEWIPTEYNTVLFSIPDRDLMRVRRAEEIPSEKRLTVKPCSANQTLTFDTSSHWEKDVLYCESKSLIEFYCLSNGEYAKAKQLDVGYYYDYHIRATISSCQNQPKLK